MMIPDLLHHCVFGIQILHLLVIIAGFHMVAEGDGPPVDISQPENHLHQGGFPDAVGSDQGNLIPLIHIEIHILEEGLTVKGF